MNVIHPDWAEPLPPFTQAHIDDLEDRLERALRRLERARGRVKRVRELRRQVRGLQAENERLRALLGGKALEPSHAGQVPG